jgi:hypothetical protein
MKKYAINLGMSLKGKQTAANQVLSKKEKRTQQGTNCEKYQDLPTLVSYLDDLHYLDR